MIGFVMVGTNDMGRARAFYDALMPLFGAALKPDWSTEQRSWYAGSTGGPMFALAKPFDGAPATAGNGAMAAFPVPSRDMVAIVHARALALGGRDEGGPGHRSDRPDDLYRAYFRDPDGNKLMVFTTARS